VGGFSVESFGGSFNGLLANECGFSDSFSSGSFTTCVEVEVEEEAPVVRGGGGGKKSGKRPPYWWEKQKSVEVELPYREPFVQPPAPYPLELKLRSEAEDAVSRIYAKRKKRHRELVALLDE
jgi:hypothetical protein